jgi:DNA-binding NarL/FixJ family response regulator
MSTYVHERGAGNKWGRGKLTPQQRWDIHQRLEEGESAKALALEYGVRASTIYNYK